MKLPAILAILHIHLISPVQGNRNHVGLNTDSIKLLILLVLWMIILTAQVNGETVTTVVTVIDDPPALLDVQYSNSRGGGDGRSGVITSEPYANVAKAETIEKNLLSNTPVAYNFIEPEHGIYQILATGIEDENHVAIRVEALKGTSKLVTASPSEITYKSVNVWAGTKKLKDVVIRFKVDNSWLKNNNLEANYVTLVKWDGNKWIRLETTEINKDSIYTYFDAKMDTPASHFSIIGLINAAVPATQSAEIMSTSTIPTPTETADRPSNAPVNLRFGLILIVFSLVVLTSLLNNRNGR